MKQNNGEARNFFDRVRSRLDHYREIGEARRQRIARGEQPLFSFWGNQKTAPVSEVQPIPGVARAALSANDFTLLEQRLGYVIKYRVYFLQALTHRSYLQFISEPGMQSNERLEFLGDAVLDLVIGEYLYREFQNLPEGDLTKLRSRLVSGAALAKHASELGLDQFMLLSTSAQNALTRGSMTLLADAYEAVIAAIYLDGGMDAARNFIYRHIITHTQRDELMLSDTNYKSMLLEYVQSQKKGVPRYLTVSEDGPNHARIFNVEVIVGGIVHGAGKGHSKKEAEQMAAQMALRELGQLAIES
jgi:ribonuclease-3